MKQHKLSGYAIKGDGTRETADRIRKVFEADRWSVRSYRFKDETYHYFDDTGRYWKDEEPQDSGFETIPLTEAEALVFGELKEGMKVVFTDEMQKQAKNAFDDKIHELEYFSNGAWWFVEGGYGIPAWLRRATITDFLRTLPEDIAERALKQVDEKYFHYEEHPENLSEALDCFADWEDTEEREEYWWEVHEGNYDRARAIIAEKDSVGKWWRMEFGGVAATFMVTSDNHGLIHGYGVDDKKGWFDLSETSSSDYICSRSVLDAKATPATPEEVERVLNDQGCVEIAKSHYVNKAGEVVEGIPVNFGDETKYYTQPNDAAPESVKTEPTDNFPRVMWVWDEDDPTGEDIETRKVIGYCDGLDAPYTAINPNGRREAHWYASDTHPVTGEPAQQKSVVEQIREVVERWESKLDHLKGIIKSYSIIADTDKNEANRRVDASEHNTLNSCVNEIKEIIKNEK